VRGVTRASCSLATAVATAWEGAGFQFGSGKKWGLVVFWMGGDKTKRGAAEKKEKLYERGTKANYVFAQPCRTKIKRGAKGETVKGKTHRSSSDMGGPCLGGVSYLYCTRNNREMKGT